LNQSWDLNLDTDDLITIISTAAIDRNKRNDVRHELENIATACSYYYQDNTAFPSALTELEGEYMDAGFEDDALEDAWNRDYRTIEYSGSSPTLRVYSYGPDGQDDQGADDDLSIIVSSIPAGRRTTRQELDIAQSVLNTYSELELVGSWVGSGGIREQLGLTETFDLDGWGNSYGVIVSSRIIYSSGPDGDAGTTEDNIPRGVGL
jgi:hypothetical protein